MSRRPYDVDPQESALPIDNYQGYPEGPQGGIYVPVPASGNPPLTIDIRNQGPSGWMGVYIEIMVEGTETQFNEPLINDGIYWVFTKTATEGLIGLPGDFQFDMVRALPSFLGVGGTVQERCPLYNPFLRLVSRNERTAEVRIRVI